MKKIIFLCLLFVAFCYSSIAQKNSEHREEDAIRKVIEGYNAKNYKLMIDPCDSDFRSVVTAEMMAKQYSAYFKKYGKATIDIIHPTFSQEDRYVAKLKMEKKSSERVYWVFNFENHQIVGYGSGGYPNICYHKRKSVKHINPTSFSNDIDKLIATKYSNTDEGSFNGSVIVLDDGKSIYHKNFGYSDYASKRKINDSTVFDLASCSKQFTAMAIFLLADRGRLNLSDSVQKFIPDFPYHNISIQQLITHTSGLPEYMQVMDKVWDQSKMATNYDVIEVMKKQRPDILFIPGERFEYCNFGYAILPVIVEKASGISFTDFLKTNVFSPLGMFHSSVSNVKEVKDKVITNVAYNYVYSKKDKEYLLFDTIKGNERAIYLGKIVGESEVYSCVKDLVLWENELRNPRVFNPAILKQAFADHKLNDGKQYANYGGGFFLINDSDLEPVVYHTGGWAAYVTVLFNFFEQKKQIILLCNNGFSDFTRLADEIAAKLIED